MDDRSEQQDMHVLSRGPGCEVKQAETRSLERIPPEILHLILRRICVTLHLFFGEGARGAVAR